MIVCGDCEKPYIAPNPYRPELIVPTCECNTNTLKFKTLSRRYDGDDEGDEP